MKRALLVITIVLTMFGVLYADGVTFNASAPTSVEVGQQFYLRYNLNTRANIQLPNISGFDIIGGPSIGSSSSIQIINGQTTQSSTFTYSYVLRANTIGSYSIPTATAIVNGKSYTCNTLNINVVKQGSGPAQTNNRRRNNTWGNNPQTQTQTPQEITASDMYIRLHLDRNTVYQGEPVLATLKIYTRLTLVGFEDFVLPEYNGFWVQEIDIPNQITLQRETVNGVVYNSAVLKKDLLYPQYSGSFEIEPAEAVCNIRQRVTGGGQNMMDAFFGHYENRSISIKTPMVKIEVKALPNNAPACFSGAVGDFSMQTIVSTDTLKTNEALSLKLTINGSGNIKLIDPPKIVFPKEFEVFDPDISTDVSLNANSGSKTFEYTLIPRYPGNYKLKDIRFAYFDPKTKLYKTLQADAINIFVQRGPEDKEGSISANYTRENVEYIGDEDIHFIKTHETNLKKGNTFLLGSFVFILLIALPLAIFIAILFFGRNRIKENSNIAKQKNKKANKVSMKRLSIANKYMQNNEREAFYKEVMSALWGYLGDKLDITAAELSKDNVSERLTEHMSEEKLTQDFLHIIELCEYAHFAPASEETQMQNIYKEAVTMINQFEQKLK